MKPPHSRRAVLTAGLAIPAATFATLLPRPVWGLSDASNAPSSAAAPVGAAFPSHDPAEVREMVGASHGNIDRVKELIARRPELAKSAWDWGFGDWETALGAASHTGNRPIAELLIEHGARPDIFTAAMLGNLEAVRAFVTAAPGIQRLPGPHGITLLSHARAGGEQAEPVVRYLTDLGGADERPPNLPLADDERDALLGTYRFGEGTEDRLEISVHQRSGNLFFQRGERIGRVLLHQGEGSFQPAGAPSVRVRFDRETGGRMVLTVHNPEPVLKAVRPRPVTS